jgi:hypothetical protein
MQSVVPEPVYSDFQYNLGQDTRVSSGAVAGKPMGTGDGAFHASYANQPTNPSPVYPVSDRQPIFAGSRSVSDSASMVKELEKAWNSQPPVHSAVESGSSAGGAGGYHRSFAASFGAPRLSALEPSDKSFTPVLFAVAIFKRALLGLKKFRNSRKPVQVTEPLLQAHVL